MTRCARTPAERGLRATALALVLGIADASSAASGEPPEVSSITLPALRFQADAATNGFFDQIQHAPQFKNLSRESLGSPITLRIYHTYRINRGSAATSDLLAAATLGLFPTVSSGEHAIVYEIYVNGALVSTHRYTRSLTVARSAWTKDTTHGLGSDGVKWAASTVDSFLGDCAHDAALIELRREFDYYFGA